MSKETALSVVRENRELLKQILGILTQPGSAAAEPAELAPVLPAEEQPAVVPKAADPAPTSVPSFEAVTQAAAQQRLEPTPTPPQEPPPGAPQMPPPPAAPEPTATPEQRMKEVIIEASAANHPYVVNYLNHFQITDVSAFPEERVEALYNGIQQYLTEYHQEPLVL